jgi:hypothetical protein
MRVAYFVHLSLFDISVSVKLGEEYSSSRSVIWSSQFCLRFNAFLLLDLLDSSQHLAPKAFP